MSSFQEEPASCFYHEPRGGAPVTGLLTQNYSAFSTVTESLTQKYSDGAFLLAGTQLLWCFPEGHTACLGEGCKEHRQALAKASGWVGLVFCRAEDSRADRQGIFLIP